MEKNKPWHSHHDYSKDQPLNNKVLEDFPESLSVRIGSLVQEWCHSQRNTGELSESMIKALYDKLNTRIFSQYKMPSSGQIFGNVKLATEVEIDLEKAIGRDLTEAESEKLNSIFLKTL